MRPARLENLSEWALEHLPKWWERIDKDENWRYYSFVGLAVAYGIVATGAIVQLVRIQMRVPEYGWTTQKVFHLLNAVVSAFRCLVFLFREQVQDLDVVWRSILLDIPGLLFFSTYTLLVLFWAEIYHQARQLPTSTLRPTFIISNVVVYVIQVGLWITAATSTDSADFARVLSCSFMALVSVLAAAGFLVYGGCLFNMLQKFPIESRGRRKKLREVGSVTAICATCFTLRALLVAWSAFDKHDADLDVMSHPLLNVIYYTLCEILPSALVLYILRRLPPRRTSGYQAIGVR